MSDPTVIEGWVEWAVGMSFIGLRIFARCRLRGRRWQGDDYLVLLSGACYTGIFVTTLIQRPRGSNVGLTDAQRVALTPAQIKTMEEGSKAILAALFVYATGLWAMKGQMLFLYRRFTIGLWQEKLVKWTAITCALFWVAIILVITCRCVPINKTWQVYPDPGESCTTSRVYYLVTEISNQITDLMLLSIPLPILLRASIKPTRKTMITILLCSSLFVFVVSIIRLVLTLGDIRHMSTLAIWAIREMFTAILCVNAPCVKPLFSSSSWLRSSRDELVKKRTPDTGSGDLALRKINKDLYPTTELDARDSTERIVRSAEEDMGRIYELDECVRGREVRTPDNVAHGWDPVVYGGRGKEYEGL